MRTATWLLPTLLSPLPLVAVLATAVAPQQGGTWTIDFDDPNRPGEVTISVSASYDDDQGVKRTKNISARVNVDDTWDATQKRQQVQTALVAAANTAENQVNGQSLIATSSLNDVMNVGPGRVSGARVDKIAIKDRGTGEDDVIHDPAQSVGLGEIRVLGEIAGTLDGSASTLSVRTDLAGASVALAPGMPASAILGELRAALSAQGLVSWVDLERGALLVLLDESISGGIGAGCTDRRAVVHCAVHASR